MKLSVVIITHNEEQNIGRCLDSIGTLADEIIVLDSFSTDQTESICKSKGVLFYQRAWMGFSHAKNFANSLATGSHILSLDADEAVSPELYNVIQEIKKNPLYDAYEISRLTQYCGKWIRHGGWYPDVKIRIFKKEACQWVGGVHEELVFNTPPKITHLSGDLLHYSYRTVDTHLRKILTYCTLAVQHDIERGKKYNLFLHGIIKPWFAFVRMYFLRLGFMDGFYGWVIACISCFEKFLRYAKYRELKNKSRS